MNGIVIGIDPVLIQVGHFAVRWYGLMIAVAIGTGIFMAFREGRRKGISDDDIYSAAFWTVIAAVIGSRLFHVVDKLDYYLSNPGAILAFSQGGLAIYGGVLTGTLAGVLFALWRHIPVGRLADTVAPGLILAQAVGRIGCIINGDVQGSPTDLPWAFVYTHPNAMAPEPGVPGHPYPAYELIWDLIVFGVLWRTRKSLKPEGMLFLVYLSLYSLGRFWLTFVRSEEVIALGLQQAQVIALASIVMAVGLMAYLRRRRPGELAAVQADPKK